MPPGWDGIVTIKKLWEVDPELQIVICSAYSDYPWEEMAKQLTHSDNFLVLKKPFELIEIRQLASSLTKKWELKKQVNYQIKNLTKINIPANLPILGSTNRGVNGSGPPVKNSVLPPPKSRSTVESQRIVVTIRYRDLTLST